MGKLLLKIRISEFKIRPEFELWLLFPCYLTYTLPLTHPGPPNGLHLLSLSLCSGPLLGLFFILHLGSISTQTSHQFSSGLIIERAHT